MQPKDDTNETDSQKTNETQTHGRANIVVCVVPAVAPMAFLVILSSLDLNSKTKALTLLYTGCSVPGLVLLPLPLPTCCWHSHSCSV